MQLAHHQLVQPLSIPCFNPHPARRPDATRLSSGGWVSGIGFNPHPARRPDATAVACRRRQAARCFNPHPARRPDATSGISACSSPVSLCFNPHPARRPDATPAHHRQCHTPGVGFNPHPARRPDATPPKCSQFRIGGRFQSSSGQKAGCNALRWRSWHRPGLLVSILIQPEGRMQLRIRRWSPSKLQVSILIRPEGRMQHLYLNFLSVLREPPDTGLPICFHCPDHFFPPATIQLRTRTSRLQWFRHWVRVRPPGVP